VHKLRISKRSISTATSHQDRHPHFYRCDIIHVSLTHSLSQYTCAGLQCKMTEEMMSKRLSRHTQSEPTTEFLCWHSEKPHYQN